MRMLGSGRPRSRQAASSRAAATAAARRRRHRLLRARARRPNSRGGGAGRARLRRPRSRLSRKPEVQPAAHLVDLDQAHADRVAEAEDLARGAALQPVLLLLVDEEIVAESGHGHESLHEIVLERHEHAERCHTRDVGVELPLELVLHEHDLLPQEALALRLLRAALPLRGEGPDLAHPIVDRVEVLRRHRVARLEQARELAVHDQVRIAADRRGEVAVVRRGQGVVTAALLGVERLALRAQQQVVQEALLGLALDLRQELLEGLRGRPPPGRPSARSRSSRGPPGDPPGGRGPAGRGRGRSRAAWRRAASSRRPRWPRA